MREIARTAGCSPATLYAHFAGKADILLYLWAFILDEMIATVDAAASSTDGNALSKASQAFVGYWTAHPERFRLVFMSSGVARADVSAIMSDPRTKGHFNRFRDLLARAVPMPNREVRTRTDTLIAGLIGVSLCLVTIKDYDWPAAEEMVDQILRGATAR
jgi:AcrR family transcriptional regulator